MRILKFAIIRTISITLLAGLMIIQSSCSVGKDYSANNSHSHVDPVCGKSVQDGTGLEYEYSGVTYYFHTEECMKVFKENPERFAGNQQNQNHMNGSNMGWWGPVLGVAMVVVMSIAMIVAMSK